MPRILRADNLSIMKTWVDAAYACHPDMRSHTGGVISFGKGVYTQKSSKQKLNTKSSTESEVVGASDYIPWAVWTGWFMEAQGYSLSKSIFYQDNQSAIRMEKNGKQSCGEKSRHINIRYFFIKDILQRENIEVAYCPTEEMVADFYTKPLQGMKFRKFCEFIMGVSFNDFDLVLREERVEDSPKLNRLYPRKTETKLSDLGDNGNNKENVIPKALKNNKIEKSVTFKDVLLGNK